MPIKVSIQRLESYDPGASQHPRRRYACHDHLERKVLTRTQTQRMAQTRTMPRIKPGM